MKKMERYTKVKKKAKTNNQYNQLHHLTLDTILKGDKNIKYIIHKIANRSTISQQAITRLQGTDKMVSQKNETY